MLNPFTTLLTTLSDTEWQVVTLEYLKDVTAIVNKPRKVIYTYGEAFSVLEFLAEADVIELQPVEDSAGVNKIRKKYGNETCKN